VKARMFGTCFLIICLFILSFAQPSVKIKFRYYPEDVFTRVHFPGSFNNWGNNSSGNILATDGSIADSLETATGFWVKTVTIAFNTYYYKIYREKSTATAVSARWLTDPLNRNINTSDNNNSILVVDNLVLYQMCAYPFTIETGVSGAKFVCRTNVPTLSAGMFQPAGNPTLTIIATIDGIAIDNPSTYYDATSGIFTYKSAGLADGDHTFKINVTNGSSTEIDSVKFEVRARPVQIQTPKFTTYKSIYVTAGIILKPDGSGVDSSVTSAMITVNGNSKSIAVTNGGFLDSTEINEGQNWIVASTNLGRDSVLVTRIVNHTPWGVVSTSLSGDNVILNASSSTDPDAQSLTNFKWLDDVVTSLGLNGQTGNTATIVKPTTAGEYYFGLIVTDPDGNADTSRSYFIVNENGSITNPSIISNPEWAKRGRIYFLFPKGFTSAGTINATLGRLTIIRDMGFNIIWMMPVMKNAYPINNGTGPGYNISDFYTVAPEYGTNQDFKNFVAQAHSLGLKVILDVTPNHSSRFHPWSLDAHTNKQKSPYWNWYEHTIISHNDNGLGQSLDADGFNYYGGFSEQLLNYNWKDVDARTAMIDVYKYWIKEFGLDGYRFDVYWGPHRRYGEQYMGKPVRDALKHIKPDILLLGEDEGTGGGTESIYADYSHAGINGGLDAAYDFKLYFNQIRNFGFTSTAVNSLHSEIWNGGSAPYFPGPNSLYLRFLESQDEDRIAYFYSSSGSLDATTTFKKTMPMASVIFTVPGLPMIWNGQEVGKGYGDNNFDNRRRGVINWDYSGKDLLLPHYQKLAQIRGQFKAFSTQAFKRINSSDGLVYAFSRPYAKEDGIVAVNFGSSASNVTISFSTAELGGWVNEGSNYVLSDLYNDVTYPVLITSGSASVNLSLPAYGSAIFVLADSAKHLMLPVGVENGRSENLPTKLQLHQNYPNPFNPSTTIQFDLPKQGQVRIHIYNILGKEIAEVVNDVYSAGKHQIMWDGKTDSGVQVSSGVYFVRLDAGSVIDTQKIVLMK
jgi:glycosidase